MHFTEYWSAECISQGMPGVHGVQITVPRLPSPLRNVWSAVCIVHFAGSIVYIAVCAVCSVECAMQCAIAIYPLHPIN